MATTPIRYQLAPAFQTSQTLYEVPLVTTAKVTILVTNRSSVTATFNLANRANGGALANEHYIAFNKPIQGNDTLLLVTNLELLAEDLIEVYCNSSDISFQIFGEETT